MHADGKVLRHVVGELEVLRQQRIEVAGGGRGDAEGKQARELRHVERAKQPREEDAFVHLDRLAVAGARIVDGDVDRALRELAAHRGDRGAQVGIDVAAPRLGLARLDQSRERRVTVGDERQGQLHRGGRDTVEDHRAHAIAVAPHVLERHARAVRAAPEVHLLVSQSGAHLVQVFHRDRGHVLARVGVELLQAFGEHLLGKRLLEERLQRLRLFLLAIEGVGAAGAALIDEQDVARVVQPREERQHL